MSKTFNNMISGIQAMAKTSWRSYKDKETDLAWFNVDWQTEDDELKDILYRVTVMQNEAKTLYNLCETYLNNHKEIPHE